MHLQFETRALSFDDYYNFSLNTSISGCVHGRLRQCDAAGNAASTPLSNDIPHSAIFLHLYCYYVMRMMKMTVSQHIICGINFVHALHATPSRKHSSAIILKEKIAISFLVIVMKMPVRPCNSLHFTDVWAKRLFNCISRRYYFTPALCIMNFPLEFPRFVLTADC